MDRWQQVSRIFHEALTRDPRDRDTFLARACADDEALRREVESMLAASDTATGLTERVHLSIAEAATSAASSSPSVARIARYRVIGRLGAGGMGEVYRARDEQLDRDVAVKVLPAASFDDPAARVRLVREARAAAALNHPNICIVHDVGEGDGQTYIAMELVEGDTLSARLAAGALQPDQVVRYGRQLADALAHAHDRGVVHRDLKSNNVMVTPDDRVKVLDFGLAKRSTEADVTAAITRLLPSLTQPGMAVGTLPYMAPEQLRGASARVSSDIWALGVVLHEMAAGTRPFDGQTPFELSAAILNEAPTPLPPHVPHALRAVIDSCLVKDPIARCASAAEVRTALERIQAGASDADDSAPLAVSTDSDRPIVRLALTRRHAIWLAAAGALLLGGLGAWRAWPAGPVRTLAVLPLDNLANDEDVAYLCEGIAGSLIRQISELESFRVKRLEDVLRFGGRSADVRSLQEAGRRLSVETILAGTLEREGDQLRITARLIDMASGVELWANRYNRDASDLLDIQNDIATSIMGEKGLRVRLTDSELGLIVRQPTRNAAAYELAMEAEYAQRRATEDDYLHSLDLLQKATRLDPKYAAAFAGIGATYVMMVTDGFMRPIDGWSMASTLMRQANQIEPDPTLELFLVHSEAFLRDWDWPGAEDARKRLLAMPRVEIGAGSGIRPMSLELWALGRTKEAVALARLAREREPTSAYLMTLEADYLLRDGQLDRAIELYSNSAERDPQNPNSLFGLAEAKYRQGRFDEALEVRRRAHAAADDDRLEPLFASARGQQGYQDIEERWQRLQLEALKERSSTAAYVSPLDFARVHAQLGEKESAFKYLEEAFNHRSPGLVFLKVDRAWDKVRDDARFAKAIQRVGLP